MNDKYGRELRVGDCVRIPMDPHSESGGVGFISRIRDDAALVKDCPCGKYITECETFEWTVWCTGHDMTLLPSAQTGGSREG